MHDMLALRNDQKAAEHGAVFQLSSKGHNSTYWHKNLLTRVWLHDMLPLWNDQRPVKHDAAFQLSSEGHNSTYWHKN